MTLKKQGGIPTTRLPYYQKQTALWIVRGYEQVRSEYINKRYAILISCPSQSGDSIGGHSAGKITDTTAQKCIQLDALDASPEKRYIDVVDGAFASVGTDMPDKLRTKLQEAMMLNCLNRKVYSFRMLGIDFVSESDFYRRKENMLSKIYSEFIKVGSAPRKKVI